MEGPLAGATSLPNSFSTFQKRWLQFVKISLNLIEEACFLCHINTLFFLTSGVVRVAVSDVEAQQLKQVFLLAEEVGHAPHCLQSHEYFKKGEVK